MRVTLALLFACVSVPRVTAMRRCLSERKSTRFYRVRSCYRSTMSVTAWRDLADVSECVRFAREKGGLAFNFSPRDVKNLTVNRWVRSCQVLGCPETSPGALVYDPVFEYYTAYADFNSTANTTCIKSVGLFALVPDKKNYTSAVDFCQKTGGDLADVLTEFRTNTLANLVKTLTNWYKAAYVGLDDIQTEGLFETPLGNSVDCTRFRAWSVGHPRPNRKSEDCVILDADRTWRVVHCKVKMPFICELYPSAPSVRVEEFKERNCTGIRSRRQRRQCLANNQLYDLYRNSTRVDQCALLNDFD